MREPRLDHLVLRCADLERSREFYEALGFVAVREKHGNGPEHYALETHGLVIELYPSVRTPTTGLRLGLEVRSLAEAERGVREVGATVVRVSESSALFLDPDGNEVALRGREGAGAMSPTSG